MKRSEEAAKVIYKDGIELFGRRDKSGNLIIHPEIMVGILRNAAARGYEQAEKDTIERAIQWLIAHADDYIVDMEVSRYKPSKLHVGGMCWEHLKKAMEGKE